MDLKIMKKLKIIPNIVKNYNFLKSHIELNEYYINQKGVFLGLDFAISHFNYAKHLISEILKDLELIKQFKLNNL